MDEHAPDRWIDQDFERKVRETAYFLWESDGRQSGREKEYWFIALGRCLREREADQLIREQPKGPIPDRRSLL
ncbi:MAG TPA: DUF2934 domain-containing protein [Devosia sp.]|nr:DUF2934 domain-containing protein [Devosia sp.]